MMPQTFNAFICFMPTSVQLKVPAGHEKEPWRAGWTEWFWDAGIYR